jgi:hypothetical protein
MADEPAQPEASEPEERTAWGPIILLVLAIGGSAVGAYLWQRSQKTAAAPDTSGFDLSQTEEARAPSASAGSSGAARTGSSPAPTGSLMTQSWGDLGKGAAAVNPIVAAAQAFADIARANEDRVRAMSERYTAAHPAFQAFGKEWMSHPDLKKLNDDYMRKHDPAAFLQGLAKSQNFGNMVKKYAVQPAFQQYVREALKIAPPNAREVAFNYLDKDKIANSVIDNVMQAIGLPPGVMGSVNKQPGQAPTIDPAKMMNSLLGSNPEYQKQLKDKDSPLNSAEFQQKVKSLPNH